MEINEVAHDFHPIVFAILVVDTPTPFASFRSDPSPPIVSLTLSGVRAILRPMRLLSVIIPLAAFVLPTVDVAEVQTHSATHAYVLGDHDSKDDV